MRPLRRLHRRISRPSPALVLASIALAAALGGSAYADLKMNASC